MTGPSGLAYAAGSLVIGKILDNSISPARDRVDI